MRSADKRLGRRGRRQVISAAIQALEPRVLLSTINGPCPDDPDGSPAPTGLTPVVTQSPTGASSTFPLSSVPQLHSDPGARDQLYLDFIGAPAQTWGAYSVPATPAFDQDGDPTTFSSGEITAIQQIWAVVAEAYSHFNIDATTVAPASLVHNQNLEIVVGGNGAWTGGSYGGLSYTGAFSNSFEPNVSWVFSNNLANAPFYCGEASSHEAGHEFGLNHQSVWSGTTLVDEYNPGNSLTAPIMGDSYGAQRGLWWDGTSDVSSTTIQDDMAVISSSTNGFGYRPQDHGQSIATANALSVSSANVSGSGIIEKTSDTDFFSFSTAAGSVTLNVNTIAFGATLHAKLQLFNASGTLIATAANANTLGQTITATLAAGTYYLSVDSYGQYGDVGQYTVSGTVATAQVTPTFTISGPASVNEGSSYTLNLSATDPGQTVSSCAINWGDGSAIQTVTGNPSSISHVYSLGPNSYTISAAATDGTGTYNASGTQPVSVLHIAPIASISGAPSVNELAAYTLNLSVLDPNHTILSWAINWGDGSAVQTVSGNPPTVTHTFATGPHSYTISATVTDDVGTYAAGNTQAVSVLHVPPTVSISGVSSVNEQSTYTLSLTASDPGHTIVSWAINWGDGSAVQTVTGDPPSVTHTFATGPNSYTISANLTDDVGTYAAAATQAVSVLHVPPTLGISGPSSVTAGAMYTLNLSSSDAGHTILSWAINWGDGSSIQNVSGNPSNVSHVYASGPASCTISATATDDVGTYSAAATVAVSVQASSGTPVFNISGPASVNEQSPYTLSLFATDPGHTVSSWAINWGDGSAVQTITGNPASVSHVYAAGPNAYSITAAATDDTGTYPAGNSQVVSVLHVPPTVAISGAGSVTLPAAYTLNLSVTDPGHAITGWTINWGDGSPAQVVGNVASVTHAFAAPGNYQINASVTDNTATFASNSLSVQVNPVPDTTPPTASASLGSVASHNTFSVTYSDNVSVKEATLGNGNVLVTGPNGFSELATLSGLSTTSNAPSITAAYILTPPGGAWTYSADGIYTVWMQPNSVTDISGNPVAAETLGTFTINIAPPSIPGKGHHTKSGTLAATGAATYVSFALAAPSMASLQLSTAQPGITLELLDANFNTIAGKSGKKSTSFAQPLNAGTYYVRVTYTGAKATTYQIGLTTKALTVAQRARLSLS